MLCISPVPSCPVPCPVVVCGFTYLGIGSSFRWSPLDDKNHNMMTMSFVNWDNKQKRDVQAKWLHRESCYSSSVALSCKNKINISIFHVFMAPTMEPVQWQEQTYHVVSLDPLITETTTTRSRRWVGEPHQVSQTLIREELGSFSW